MATQETSVFISHNIADADFGQKLAAALALAGSRVWYDEWSIRPGDSIAAAVENGLAAFNTFALLWSRKASKSRWVRVEMDAALTKMIKQKKYRLVPIPLDATPLPELLQSIKYVDGRDGDHIRVARELLNIDSDAAFRLAVQHFIGETGIPVREFLGVGVLVACPQCGATPDNIEPWEDWAGDDHYVGARCTVCGWSDGSEV